uniref:Thyroglobulin type-1 domain-containing protein n=1 Tax=Seriola lalandi dorsalis TaxID=1841481 RepID=A0A3B4WGN3_SERLL
RRSCEKVRGRPGVGAFIPQCDSDGRYRPLQCHGSTGHCWCVDSRGQERAGTRTPPGTAPRDCDRPGIRWFFHKTTGVSVTLLFYLVGLCLLRAS